MHLDMVTCRPGVYKVHLSIKGNVYGERKNLHSLEPIK